MDFSTIARAVEGAALIVRGGFHPERDDGVPSAPDGTPTGTLILVGNAGPQMWAAFASSPEAGTGEHRLDRWSKRVLGALAERLDARALFPCDGPPYLPFQRWAQRAEDVWPSPIGPLIHPEYGLWHAYRGALAFAPRIALPERERRPNPCDRCADRPCLHTCPVDAFGDARYDVPRCVAHISSAAGRDCIDTGCRARLACPIGREYHYAPAQSAFHMQAFVRARVR